MKINHPLGVILAVLLAAPAAAQTVSTRPITLPEAYALALDRSETLASDVLAVKAALARVVELQGEILPHVNLIGSENFQENPHSGIAALDKTSYPLGQLQLTQPLFAGFRDFLAYKQGKKQAQSAQLTERRAESLLYQDVAQAYFTLLQAQDEIVIRGKIVTETQERIGQLEHWVRIGRSRESEVLAARSQLAVTQAQVELARGNEAVAQELLRFLTGVDAVFAPQPVASPAAEPLEPFVVRARARDDVEAQRRNLDAARLFTRIQRNQHYPTIDLTADYYLKRIGFAQNTHYDGVIALNLPIFQGGVIMAQTKEAKAAEGQAEQALSLAARQAEEQARSAYRTLSWSLSAVEAFAKAASLAEQNVKAQEQDYKLSLVTNLEVLDSLNTLQSTALQLDQQRQQAAFARAQLEVAAGGPERPNTREILKP